MAGKSSIEWTDATWNPVTGCTKISSGSNIPLKNQNSNNRYGLFFISGHKLGAYKFLKVREELKA